jgi:arylsulfatase A-like enzyme
MNVLLVVADDMRADLLPFMPFANSVLRRAGTQLTSMRVSVPLCTPARGAIATGLYAFRPENGLHGNVGDIADPTTHALPVWLRRAGVTTGMFGKYTTPGVTSPPGGAWNTWRVAPTAAQEPYTYVIRDENGAVVTPSAPTPHQTDYFAEQISTFITTAPSPWFCQYSASSPHVNNAFQNNPKPESMGRYGWLQWPFDLLEDVTAKPSWIQALDQFSALELSVFRQGIRQQCREVRDLDGVLRRLYDDLVLAGTLAETLIILTSDSGVLYGEQRQGGEIFPSMKDVPYDCVAKAPCILVGSGFPVGRVFDHACVLQDLTATIVAALDAQDDVSVALDGLDLANLDVDDTQILGRPGTLYERLSSPAGPDAQGIVNPASTRKLIRYPGATGDDRYEMYDLDTDPGEKVNVANEASRLIERSDLEERLDAILA